MYFSLLNDDINEAVKYGTKEDIIRVLEITESSTLSLEKQVNQLSGREELLEEQLYFAREILDNLENSLKNSTKLSEFKKEFKQILENSYFER